jgi:hypothetical protein
VAIMIGQGVLEVKLHLWLVHIAFYSSMIETSRSLFMFW